MISIKNLSKKYGTKVILDNISLDIVQGDFVAIIGTSGCGKSTLLNIIGLLEKFDTGDITIDGDYNVSINSIKSNKILREKINYLFQNFALIDDETVEYNLKLSSQYLKLSNKAKKILYEESLTKVGLNGFLKRKVYELSGGEQQRVALARILIKPCKIILADEPTGSLDESNRDIILDLLHELNSIGKTVIIVTHDKEVASRCKRIINLDELCHR